ncbi:arsenic resistance protein [Alteribacillus sp. JSM 102045]|uniref:arsenic resistance protein n=1 Tax=Alteribacillus sp. JSM 102045 TaxID=1562101 RepID=UPI0035C16A60
MTSIDKRQFIITSAILVLGILLSFIPFFPMVYEMLITVTFLILLYLCFVNLPISNMRHNFHYSPPFKTAVIINFVLVPLLAGGVGYIFLPNYPELWLAFIILMVIPSMDGNVPFTKYVSGNVDFSLALIPIHLTLQLILVPLYLILLTGKHITFDDNLLVLWILCIISVPLAAALITKRIAYNLGEDHKLRIEMSNRVPFLIKLFFNLGILFFFLNHGHLVASYTVDLILFLFCIFIFIIMMYMITKMICLFLRCDYKDKASLVVSVITRDSPIALFIAISSFPPLVGMAVAIGYISQFPLLRLLLNRMH